MSCNFIADGINYFILWGLVFVYWQKPCMAIHQDDICGNSNGRRLYLELGEHGILTAMNVTSLHGLRPPQTSPGINIIYSIMYFVTYA